MCAHRAEQERFITVRRGGVLQHASNIADYATGLIGEQRSGFPVLRRIMRHENYSIALTHNDLFYPHREVWVTRTRGNRAYRAPEEFHGTNGGARQICIHVYHRVVSERANSFANSVLSAGRRRRRRRRTLDRGEVRAGPQTLTTTNRCRKQYCHALSDTPCLYLYIFIFRVSQVYLTNAIQF